MGRHCRDDGRHGFLRVQALFDENGSLNIIEVRARDNSDEGWFRIFEMKVDVKQELEGTCLEL